LKKCLKIFLAEILVKFNIDFFNNDFLIGRPTITNLVNLNAFETSHDQNANTNKPLNGEFHRNEHASSFEYN
jgi:hypothetical protein